MGARAIHVETSPALPPRTQQCFGIGLDPAEACIGRGVMSTRRGPWWTVPCLRLGRLRRVLVPDVGSDVPFTVENDPYRDCLGRETATVARTSATSPGRGARFDATGVLVDGRVADCPGTHQQHPAVDLDLRVDDRGGLVPTSGAQRSHEGPIAFRFPMLLSGRATLHENWSEEDESFHVDPEVRSTVFSVLVGCTGSFRCERGPATDAPERSRPVRSEART